MGELTQMEWIARPCGYRCFNLASLGPRLLSPNSAKTPRHCYLIVKIRSFGFKTMVARSGIVNVP